MALHRMGLGAEFTLNTSQAVKSSRTASQSIGNLRQGLTQLSMAAAPVAIAMGALAKSAMDFNAQSSATQSVALATGEEMKGLRKEAMMLALDTKFSHTEAMNAMELLTRAGFSQTEMLEGLRPVMDAAAADGIELSTAANIVASAIRGMGLEATDAARVADVLALASARSNTNITMIGDSMRYAQSQAKLMGIDLETTVAVIGALGDAGLKGSIAGTSFANMLKKMASPSGKGAKLMAQYGVAIKNFDDGAVDVISTMKTLQPALLKMNLAQEKAAFVAELFGIRGQKAVSAIVTSIEKGRFEMLHEELTNATGAAKKMAEIRLDNTIGQFTKLRKAVGVLATEIFDPFLSSMKGMFSGLHHHLTSVLKASIEINDAQDAIDVEAVRQKYGVYAEIALGIQDAALAVKNAFDTVTEAFGKAGDKFKDMFGEGGLRDFTKFVVLAGIAVAVLVPLALGIAGVAMALGGLKIMLMSIGSLLLAMNPWVLAIIGIFALLVTLTGGWGDLWEGLSSGITLAITTIKETLEWAMAYIAGAFDFMGDGLSDWTIDWKMVGTVIMGVLTSIVVAIATVVAGIIELIGNIIKAVTWVANKVRGIFNLLFQGILMMAKGDLIGGMKHIFSGLVDVVLVPIRAIAKEIVKLADFFGKGSWIPDAMRKFAQGGPSQAPDGGKRGAPKIKKQKRGVQPETAAEEMTRLRIANRKRASQYNAEQSDFGPVNELLAEVAKNTKDAADVANKDQTTEICIDGRKVAKATNKHRQIDKERGGGSEQWQRRRALQTTAV